MYTYFKCKLNLLRSCDKLPLLLLWYFVATLFKSPHLDAAQKLSCNLHAVYILPTKLVYLNFFSLCKFVENGGGGCNWIPVTGTRVCVGDFCSEPCGRTTLLPFTLSSLLCLLMNPFSVGYCASIFHLLLSTVPPLCVSVGQRTCLLSGLSSLIRFNFLSRFIYS